jgi:hypothetical protein
MKVFVSHSMKDNSMLNRICTALSEYGIELLIAEHAVNMKSSVSEKIKFMIESSHVALILLTKNGFESGFVREEIGYLEAKNRPCLIILEKGLEKAYGGFKYGYDYIEHDPNLPEITIDKINQILIDYWKKFINTQKQIALNKEMEREQKNTFIGFGILAGLLVLLFSNN